MSFQSKMKPRYYHIFFGSRMGPPKTDKMRGRGLNAPWDLEK